MAAWKFDRRQGICTACERSFEEGERHVSTLCFDEEALVREDLCASCWTERRKSEGAKDPNDLGDLGDDLFWWFTRHVAGKKRTLQLDLASLERLFVELEGREETYVRELRYVLCLILMRKRRLKVEKIQRSEEGESFLVKRPRIDQRYQVFVFDFTAERMAELRGEMEAIFEGADEDGAIQLPGGASPEPGEGAVPEAEPEPAGEPAD